MAVQRLKKLFGTRLIQWVGKTRCNIGDTGESVDCLFEDWVHDGRKREERSNVDWLLVGRNVSLKSVILLVGCILFNSNSWLISKIIH